MFSKEDYEKWVEYRKKYLQESDEQQPLDIEKFKRFVASEEAKV